MLSLQPIKLKRPRQALELHLKDSTWLLLALTIIKSHNLKRFNWLAARTAPQGLNDTDV